MRDDSAVVASRVREAIRAALMSMGLPRHGRQLAQQRGFSFPSFVAMRLIPGLMLFSSTA
jgi:hypothetical protein